MFKISLKSLLLASVLVSSAAVAIAQDITLRATANSNENDEDYDGLVVFKNYVENASNGSIKVELFIGTQLCAKGDECLAVTTPLRPPAGSRRSDLRYVFNDVISDVSYAGVCDAWRNSWAGATAFVE